MASISKDKASELRGQVEAIAHVCRRLSGAGQQHPWASDAEIIDVNGLPFSRDEESLATSGIGISTWGGGEYQHPLAERLRLRVGADVAVQQFEGGEFDQLFLAGRAGPRWLVSENTDVSVLADTSIRWFGNDP